MWHTRTGSKGNNGRVLAGKHEYKMWGNSMMYSWIIKTQVLTSTNYNVVDSVLESGNVNSYLVFIMRQVLAYMNSQITWPTLAIFIQYWSFSFNTMLAPFLNVFSSLKKYCILIKILYEFAPGDAININQSLVQIMAWSWTGDKPLSEPMMT